MSRLLQNNILQQELKISAIFKRNDDPIIVSSSHAASNLKRSTARFTRSKFSLADILLIAY